MEMSDDDVRDSEKRVMHDNFSEGSRLNWFSTKQKIWIVRFLLWGNKNNNWKSPLLVEGKVTTHVSIRSGRSDRSESGSPLAWWWSSAKWLLSLYFVAIDRFSPYRAHEWSPCHAWWCTTCGGSTCRMAANETIILSCKWIMLAMTADLVSLSSRRRENDREREISARVTSTSNRQSYIL